MTEANTGWKRRAAAVAPVLAAVVVFALLSAFPLQAHADECPAGGSHVFSIEVITSPTATSDGTSLYTCKKCGFQEYVTVAATGHEWSDWYTVQEPTCTGEGIEERVCAKHAGNVHYEQRVIPMLSATGEHAFVETSRTEPTCTEDGGVTYTCSVCGYTYTDTLPATGHAWGPWIVDVRPYATEEAGESVLHDGSEHRVCANDASHRETQAIPARPEDFDTPQQAPEEDDGGEAEVAIEDEPAPEPEPEPAPERQSPLSEFFTAGPNRFDQAMLGADLLVLVLAGGSSLSLIYASVWIHRRRREAMEQAGMYASSDRDEEAPAPMHAARKGEDAR